MSKKIITTIDKKTGQMTVKTEGYNGAECLEGAAAQLEKELGMTADGGSCQLTTEYFQNKEDNQNQVGGA